MCLPKDMPFLILINCHMVNLGIALNGLYSLSPVK